MTEKEYELKMFPEDDSPTLTFTLTEGPTARKRKMAAKLAGVAQDEISEIWDMPSGALVVTTKSSSGIHQHLISSESVKHALTTELRHEKERSQDERESRALLDDSYLAFRNSKTNALGQSEGDSE